MNEQSTGSENSTHAGVSRLRGLMDVGACGWVAGSSVLVKGSMSGIWPASASTGPSPPNRSKGPLRTAGSIEELGPPSSAQEVVVAGDAGATAASSKDENRAECGAMLALSKNEPR